MAKEKKIEVNSRLKTDELKKDVETAVKELNKVKEAAEGKDPKTGRDITDTKKKWGDFANLFSGTLPRDIQMTIRKFKSKTREVARATRGMDKFNKVMKGFGGPILAAVILGLEKLIEYLPQIIDYFTGNTAAVKALTAANEAAIEVMDRYVAQNQAYFDILVDTNAEMEQRIAAQNYLARSVEGLRDINLEAADAVEQLNEAYAKQAERQANEAAMKELQDQYLEYTKKRGELEQLLAERTAHLTKMGYENVDQQRVVIEVQEDLADLEEEYAKLLQTRSDISQQIIEDEAERARVAREAREEEEQRNRVFKLNEQVYKMEQEMRLDRMDEYDREIAKIDEKEREQLMAAHAANASEEQVTTIMQYYAAQRAEVRDKEAAAQEAEAERQRQEDERAIEAMANLRKRIAEATMDDEERALQGAKDRFAELIAQAEEAGLDTVALETQLQIELESVRSQFAEKRLTEAQRVADEEAKIERDKLKLLTKLYADNEQKSRELRLAQLEIERKEAMAEANKLGVSLVQVKQYYDNLEAEINAETTNAMLDERKESMDTFRDGMGSLYDALTGMMDRNSKNAKRLAVIEVLINQAQALAKGINAAIETTPKTPAYPFMLAGNIAGIAATILTGFTQIKSILDSAGASSGGGMSARMPTQALVPSVTATAEAPKSMNVSAYVVQSDLQGSNRSWESLGKRITL